MAKFRHGLAIFSIFALKFATKSEAKCYLSFINEPMCVGSVKIVIIHVLTQQCLDDILQENV